VSARCHRWPPREEPTKQADPLVGDDFRRAALLRRLGELAVEIRDVDQLRALVTMAETFVDRDRGTWA
jgi:hypothetical protein